MLAKIYLEITTCCNLTCSFCMGTQRKKQFMTEEEFFTLSQKLVGHTKFLYFHLMGEPFIHPLLPRFLEIADELGFRVVLTTNGTLLDTQDILDAPALHKVNISLHAPEANRGISLPSYMDSCGKFATKAWEKGVLISLRLWNLDGEGTVGQREENQEILKQLHLYFPETWAENAKGFRLKNRVFLEWGEKFLWPDMQGQEFGHSGFCYGLRDQVGVLCDGTVVPCCLDHEGDIALGNLFHSDLDEILKSTRAKALYDGFSDRKMAEALCRKCGFARRF